MSRYVLLDSGPLGMVTHPRRHGAVKIWLEQLLAGGVLVCIAEIADYEVRRELFRVQASRGLRQLDELADDCTSCR